MGLRPLSSLWITKPSNLSSIALSCVHSPFTGRKFRVPHDSPKVRLSKLCYISAFASQKSVKKFRRQREAQKDLTPQRHRSQLDEHDGVAPGVDNAEDSKKESSFENVDAFKSIKVSSRSDVLKACTVTSGLIAVLGVSIRQVSHVASAEGWPILDCSTETWPDFAESSEAANQQVLTPLQPLDYLIVTFLPGVTEELLFRGALLPLFGVNWKSALVVAALFGVLHLGSGRNYSFAIWATFVGFVYGYATILTSSLVVPMATHAANNLVGGLLWRYTSKASK